jgi:cytochrome c553
MNLSRFLVPVIHVVAISGLAFTLIIIVIANSHWTHGHLSARGYDRTEIARVDGEYDFEGQGLADPELAATGDLVADGFFSFFQFGCASCHGLTANGGVVGPDLPADISASKVLRELRDGPEGMPAYSESLLSDEAAGKIVAYLKSRDGESPTPANDDSTRTPGPDEPTATSTPPGPSPTATEEPSSANRVLAVAAPAGLTIDGDRSDWADIDGLELELRQFDIPAGSDWEFDGEVAPKAALMKVATDANNIYVLIEVEDSFDYVAGDRGLSPALGVMFQIEAVAGPHMGATDDDIETGVGMVDIWHWQLDCAAGTLSGGGDPGDGNDPDCNLDDEYATDPEERDDDDQAGAENSLVGSWSHTATSIGADGTWIFEMSRPLNTGDQTDAQFTSGGTALAAVAYWDPKESVVGWSDAGHVTSADLGWIEIVLP